MRMTDRARVYQMLVWAADTVSRRVNRYLRSVDLTGTQRNVLHELRNGALPNGVLADRVGRSHGDVTLVVDRLIRRGYVIRRQIVNDRRVRHVWLTDEGADVVGRVCDEFGAVVAREMRLLNDEEMETLGVLCCQLCGRRYEEEEQDV